MQNIDGEKKNGPMFVGIGASAGGVDALMRLFEQMPTDSGLAFAVVLHTMPDHDSHLAEVLQTRTGIPVSLVSKDVHVEPNNIYCIPPDKRVSLADGRIRLVEPDAAENGHNAPIDLFFRTLAHEYRDKAIVVVLSGAGADGSLGLGRIREEGGVSIAQDPLDAEHATMPRSAIETGWVDFILPVASIPEKLVSLKQNAERIQLPPVKTPPRNVEEDALRELLALLRARTRHDFSNYKRSTLLRRIERRLQVTESEDIRAYLEYIRKSPEELQGLLRDLLISVTNFFRDPTAFYRLQEDVVPKLFEGKGASDQLRVWVAGCASGEEAYSIAMLLAEHADTLASPPALQIFATDIDEDALPQGRQGLYPHTISADVSPERLKRFFVKEGQYYRVKRDLREMVLFAPHNILRDPPFSKLNLVSCRNLLIYINRNMQERILEIFHFALKPDGHLLLGSSESAEGLSDLFTSVNKKHRIFKRSEDGAHAFKAAPPPPVAGEWVVRPTVLPAMPQPGAHTESVTYGELHYRMLESLAPPSVLVNADYDIVHLSEHAGRYLRLSGGEPTRNLLKVAHPDLRLELRSLLISAAQHGDVMSGRAVVNLDGSPHFVRVVVRPVAAPQANAQPQPPPPAFMLVVFEEGNALPEASDGGEEARDEDATVIPSPPATLEPIVRQLETELERTRDQLRATIEEYETSTEELKASNEELQAMNEELRSASEELETGKEELQSVNEELTTLNTELREKVDEIGRSNSDLQNLMASTRIATIFLDRALRLKRYTPMAQELFNIIPGDVGRPLAHITHKLEYVWMVDDAERVLRDLHTVEREVAANDGRYFLARLLPYRTIDDKINGVVLTFMDVTEHKAAQEELGRQRDLLSMAMQTTQTGWGAWDWRTGAVEWSENGKRLMGFESEEEAGTAEGWMRRIHPEDRPALEAHAREAAAGHRDIDIEYRIIRSDGEVRWLHGSGTIIYDEHGEPIRSTGFVTDVTGRKRAEEALRTSEGRLRGLKEAFQATVNGAPLADSLNLIARMVTNETAGEARTAFYIADPEGKSLYTVRGAGDMPESYADRIDGFLIGEDSLACGLAVPTGRPVLTRDVYEDPLWKSWVHIAEEFDYRGCWSFPIKTHNNEAVGTFAMYFRAPREAAPRDLELADTVTQAAGVIISSHAETLRRARAEEAMRASEERLRLVVETAEDYAIMLMDGDGRYTSWNSGAEKMFGYKEEEVLGKFTSLIFTPEDREAGVPEQEIRTADRDGRAADERWHLRKDGSRFYVSGVMVSLRLGRGYAKIARDLTAQRTAQDDLQKAWEGLEKHVEERTAELAEANSALKGEVGRRRRSDQDRVTLLRRIVTTQEEERQRISRELHDQLGQSLTALRLKLEGLKSEAGKRSKLQGKITELTEILGRLDADVDFLAWELRPTALDDLGLIVALSNFAQEWSNHFNVKVNFHSAGLGEARLSPLVETNLYRIAQEALNNVSKHAGATSVDMLLERRDHHAVLIVEDNGRGFDPEEIKVNESGRGMGLIGMRERAALVGGTVEIESRQGGGTTIFARVPIKFPPAEGLEDAE